MKFAHISDLHLGKKLYQSSLIEDQTYILDQICQIVERKQADGVLIAGDIYDKVYPCAEAVALFDSFVVRLAESKCKVFVISGNHDSPERVAFLGRLTRLAGVYLSPVYDGTVSKITLEDEYGRLNVHLLPFVKPIHVRHFSPEKEVTNYTQALQAVIDGMEINDSERNILIAHQFVTGAMRSESEEISVGGLDNVDGEVFQGFDYVALGHLHKAQNVMVKGIRYCGSPLKYSFSESEDDKSVTIVELKEKGQINVELIPLKPLREVRRLRGTFENLIQTGTGPGEEFPDYVQVTLLDEEDVPNAFGRLSLIYPGLLRMEYDNVRTAKARELTMSHEQQSLNPMELFSSFYEEMNNQPLTKPQKQYLEKKMEAIWKGERQ